MRLAASLVALGISIVAAAPPALPPYPYPPGLAPPPPMPPGTLWRIAYTSMRTTMETAVPACSLSNNGLCVTDGEGDHGNNERCTFLAVANMYVTATHCARALQSR